MSWEISFLEKLGQIGNANSNMNWLSWILLVITFTCDHGVIWIVLAIVLICMKKTRRIGFGLGLTLFVFLFLINNIFIKNIVARPRPFEVSSTLYANVSHWMFEEGKSVMGFFEIPDSYSFPSGHTASSFLAASVLIYYNKKAGIAAYIYAFILGFTRMYFGVHYPTDVLFGMIYGVSTGFIGVYMYEYALKSFKERKRKRA